MLPRPVPAGTLHEMMASEGNNKLVPSRLRDLAGMQVIARSIHPFQILPQLLLILVSQVVLGIRTVEKRLCMGLIQIFCINLKAICIE